MSSKIIQEVRKNNPLIHVITNEVVMNFTANGLLSFGASPIMAKAVEEVSDISTLADGLLINIGTLTTNEVEAMIIAGKAANKKGIPVVLDPVGVAATPFRTKAVQQIIKEVSFTAIKGNAGEMAHLVQIPWQTKGVESMDGGNMTEEIAIKVSNTFKTAAIVTGKVDVICVDNKVLHNETGAPLLTKVTGAGCLLGAILTACLTTNESIENQALTAVQFYGMAAEHAVANSKGSGTFLPKFIDALSI